MTCGCEKNLNPMPIAQAVKCVEATLFHKVIRPASLGDETVTPPEELEYKNVLLVYEASGQAYLYSSDGVPTFISYLPTDVKKLQDAIDALEAEVREEFGKLHDDLLLEGEERQTADAELRSTISEATANLSEQIEGVRDDLDTMKNEVVTELRADIDAEQTAREDADVKLQGQIDALADRSDVVDVVGTYAELKSYDTKDLGDKDIVKVLNDETHDDAITYYRWDKTAGAWGYVGETGPYYTKAEVDEIDNGIKHDIENITELLPTVKNEYGTSETDVLSQGFVSGKLNGDTLVAGKNALSETPNTNESIALGKGAHTYARNNQTGVGADNYAVAIGSGSYAFSGNVTHKSANNGTNTAVVIGRSATTDSRYNGTSDSSAGYNRSVVIGDSANAVGQWTADGVAIGYKATIRSADAHNIAIGPQTSATGDYSMALGDRAVSESNNASVAIGYRANTSRPGEVSVGSTKYPNEYWGQRYLANVRAGELDTDATNLAQVRQMIEDAWGGGGGGTFYEEWGESSEAGLSQKFLSETLNGDAVALGEGAKSSATNDNQSIALGKGATATARNSYSTMGANNYAIVLGVDAHATSGNSSQRDARAGDNYAVVLGHGATSNSQYNGTTDSNRGTNRGVVIGNGANAKGEWEVTGVAIGYKAAISSAYSNGIAIGPNSSATSGYGISIGENIRNDQTESIALGHLADTSRALEVSIGSTRYPAYNRYLANVKAGELDTDAVNVKQMQDYVAEHAGGGSSVEVLEAYGNDSKATLSQKFISDKLNGTSVGIGSGSAAYVSNCVNIGTGVGLSIANSISIGTGADVSSSNSIAIGHNAVGSAASNASSCVAIGPSARARLSSSVALGSNTYVNAAHGVALGPSARVNTDHAGSVALGYLSDTGRADEVSIGNPDESMSGGAVYRYIANVKAGELDTDAVNVAQLNEAVGNINTLLETLISGEGAK